MTVSAPPRPPRPDDPEALIEEARRRQRRRRLRVAVALLAVAGAGAMTYALFGRGGGRHRHASTTSAPAAPGLRCPGKDLGTVAFVRDGALAIVDLRSCRTRVLVPTHVTAPVAFSADGRYVSFSGGYVPSSGGTVQRTPGTGTWSPRDDLLAVSTSKGGLELIGPKRKPRTLLPDGWGVATVVFSLDGRTLAASRSLYAGPSQPPPYHEEIWLVDVASGKRHLVFQEPPRWFSPPWLYGFSPDGRWLVFWLDSQNSGSLAADGLPLLALRTSGGRASTITSELHYPDFLTWCRGRLFFVVNHGGRLVTLGDGLAEAAPPRWRPRTMLRAGGKVSWNSIACASGGSLVVAAGPTSQDEPFGHERRSLFLVPAATGGLPKLLAETAPPSRQTDELPMSSGDGRWILFVRTRSPTARGSLYALDRLRGKLIGPITEVGGTANYYGSYAWVQQLAWHR